MKIVLIRHGESEGNVADIINDNPSRIVNLTQRGRQQAESASVKLRGMRFTQAFASEFPRAGQTADILLRYQTCTLKIDARLNERRSGMDGLPVHVFNDLVRVDPVNIKPEHGESFLEQMERLRSFLDETSTLYPDATVLAVSHENPILAALAVAGDEPRLVVRRNIANCEWVELVWPVV